MNLSVFLAAHSITMADPALIARLTAVIERLQAEGINWTFPGLPELALRRWSSFARRHKNAASATHADRVNDRAKGLQAHFEPDTPFTHPAEWQHLAESLAAVLTEAATD